MKKQRTRMMRVTCPECNRNVAAYIPKGGDGSALRIRRHKRQSRGVAVGPLLFVCDGSYFVVDVSEAAGGRGEKC